MQCHVLWYLIFWCYHLYRFWSTLLTDALQLFDSEEVRDFIALSSISKLLYVLIKLKKCWECLRTRLDSCIHSLLLFSLQLVFSTEHTNALSHVVQELILSPPDPDTSGHLDPTTAARLDQERTELLQLALARNLCRAMLEESSLWHCVCTLVYGRRVIFCVQNFY